MDALGQWFEPLPDGTILDRARFWVLLLVSVVQGRRAGGAGPYFCWRAAPESLTCAALTSAWVVSFQPRKRSPRGDQPGVSSAREWATIKFKRKSRRVRHRQTPRHVVERVFTTVALRQRAGKWGAASTSAGTPSLGGHSTSCASGSALKSPLRQYRSFQTVDQHSVSLSGFICPSDNRARKISEFSPTGEQPFTAMGRPDKQFWACRQ